MLNRKSRTRKVFLQTSSVSSLLESNLKMDVRFPIIIFKRSRPFTWSSVSVEVCRFSSRL
ncbi:hypothetical protein BCR41DRAFT_354687 [Lobosporangium transversale]|uniref:Uncharacterized protein n=1 Tax=Lobosporangium transversale TaxID=64571 RepID=A0A1Y2GL86_9FUNG|nr:hypothetical protein BCR41DRAFT_354687 [Lobosporangium transversale]ORZ14329.1 hypothetical protein BCR41DRAFT_354687 [Lobosporangium transversale]|eukprot:XP_021880807.1 hypothetical protein BCR41DRAFT_354687 [Lobosporangium transversale]